MMYVYSVYDSSAESFTAPFVCENDYVAVRQFEHLCFDETTFFRTHPTDFVIYRIGEFDNKSGEIFNSGNVLVDKAVEVLRRFKIPFYDLED